MRITENADYGKCGVWKMKSSGKKQTSKNFYKNNDTFEFARHVSVVQRPSSVESRINLKLHLNL